MGCDVNCTNGKIPKFRSLRRYLRNVVDFQFYFSGETRNKVIEHIGGRIMLDDLNTTETVFYTLLLVYVTILLSSVYLYAGMHNCSIVISHCFFFAKKNKMSTFCSLTKYLSLLDGCFFVHSTLARCKVICRRQILNSRGYLRVGIRSFKNANNAFQ